MGHSNKTEQLPPTTIDVRVKKRQGVSVGEVNEAMWWFEFSQTKPERLEKYFLLTN